MSISTQNLSSSADLDSIREITRRFAEERIRPMAAELDENERFPEELYTECAALGLFGITVPQAMGGLGADVSTYAVVMEELSRGYASVADQCGLIELIGTLLATHGTPEQVERYLPATINAQRRCAYALTEAEAGSDLAGLKTIAVKSGDGWELTGQKLWIHNAPVADFAFVLARTDPAAGHRGMSIFIVDLQSAGMSRAARRNTRWASARRQVGALHFREIKLPHDALLGPEGRGFHIMMSVLEKGRVGIAALAVGIAQAGA